MFASRLILPLLFLPLAARVVLAQPPTAPSTIKKPATQPGFAPPAPLPDPALISPAELQTLTGGPTKVTLSGVDLPLKDALKSLLDSAGMTLSPFQPVPEANPLSVDWQQTAFWDAALDLEKHSGGSFDARFGNGIALTTRAFPREMMDFGMGVNVGAGKPSLQGRGAAQTPFVRLVANSIARTATRGLRLGEIEGEVAADGFQAPPDRVQLALTAFFDPKLKVVSVELRNVVFEGAPRQTERVVMGGARFVFNSGRTANLISPQSIAIPPSFAPGSRITRLSGILHSVLETQIETWKIADIGAAPKSTRTIGGLAYDFEPLEPRENMIVFRLTQPGPRAGLAQFQSVRLRDAAGREVPGGPSRIENQKAEFNFRPGAENPGPYSLEWPIVTQTRSLDVPFELRDVVVP